MDARLDEVGRFSHAIRDRSQRRNSLPWALVALGVVGLVVAIAVSPSDARLATDQDWSPFVLVTGLLLIGMVANDDGLFVASQC